MSATPHNSSSKVLQLFAEAALPERVRALLKGLHALAMESLGGRLGETTATLERDLFRQAERANVNRQSELYSNMRALREHNDVFVAQFELSLAKSLLALNQPVAAGSVPTDSAAFQNLTLVQDTDIDRDIILNELARREASKRSTPLILLGQRFGVLAGGPAMDAEQLPLGPYALCRALRQGGEALQIALDAQLALYHSFESQVMGSYGELLERANVYLAHEGVLPGLVYQPYFAKGPTPKRHYVAGEGNDAAGRTASNRPLTSWMGQGPAASWAPPTGAGPAAGAAAPSPYSGGDAAGVTGGDFAQSADGAPAPAQTPMSSLQQLLGAARAAVQQGGQPGAGGAFSATVPAGAPASAGGIDPGMLAALSSAAAQQAPASGQAPVPVPSASVMDVLGKLQAQAAVQAATGQRRTIGDIQQALLSQMRAEYGPQATLQPQDADTMDLLGMLYGQIQREVRNETPAAAMLTQLQVPLVRAAISDPAFFIRDQHPARELLNAVAESGATWLSDEDMDPVLLQRLGRAVERVVTDYQGDEAVFATANAEVQGYFRAAAHKAEITERRQIEAAKGKERLETAKQLAERTITQICNETPPPKFVQTLLQNAWSDVLTLTVLRQGESSPEWRELREATRQVAELTASDAPAQVDPELSDKVEEALKRVGYHDEEAGAIARRMSTPGGEDETLSRTELLAKLKGKSRLGVDEAKQAAEEAKPKQPARNEVENAFYQQLRVLPFGTWFEFVYNQQGDSRRQRLSWYSLITDNALFVNARGQKIAEHTLDALARLMAQNQVRIVTEDKGRLIDRAWQATLRALRALSGSPTPEDEQ